MKTACIRSRVLMDLGCHKYTEYAKHKDMVGISVSAEHFIDAQEEEEGYQPDFSELLVMIEKKWLFDYMRNQGIKHPRKYLKNKYDYSDAIGFYDAAMSARKIAMIAFN